jgi:hypothetical protein
MAADGDNPLAAGLRSAQLELANAPCQSNEPWCPKAELMKRDEEADPPLIAQTCGFVELSPWNKRESR